MPGKERNTARQLVPAIRQPPASRFSDCRPVNAQRGCAVNKHQDTWELYYLPKDFSRAHNIGAEHPDKLAELKELFWQEAPDVPGTAPAGRLLDASGSAADAHHHHSGRSAETCRMPCPT